MAVMGTYQALSTDLVQALDALDLDGVVAHQNSNLKLQKIIDREFKIRLDDVTQKFMKSAGRVLESIGVSGPCSEPSEPPESSESLSDPVQAASDELK